MYILGNSGHGTPTTTSVTATTSLVSGLDKELRYVCSQSDFHFLKHNFYGYVDRVLHISQV